MLLMFSPAGLASERTTSLAVLRPAQGDGVQHRALGGEADFPGVVLEVLAEVAALDPHGAFAVDQPGPGAVDRLAVDGRPIGQLAEHLLDLGIERTVGPLHDVQQQVAVLAHVVDEHVDDPTHGAELPVAVVEPVADRSVGLPGMGIDLGHDAAFQVLDPAAFGRSACSCKRPGSGRRARPHWSCRGGRSCSAPPCCRRPRRRRYRAGRDDSCRPAP